MRHHSFAVCRQEILLLDNEIAFNEAIIEEREQGFRDIEEQIGQANEIFKDLAVLVHEQGVVIGKTVVPSGSVIFLPIAPFCWPSSVLICNW